MIEERRRHRCNRCESTALVRNGTDPKGKQKYHCKDCGSYGTVAPTRSYREADRERILKAYQERASMRGIERVFGVARQTLARWLKKSLPAATPGNDLAACSSRGCPRTR